MTDRMAKCCECGKIAPSSQVMDDLKTRPFFTACGPGSEWSRVTCVVCGDHVAGHDSSVSTRDHRFQPGGTDEHDDYYCGCKGPTLW